MFSTVEFLCDFLEELFLFVPARFNDGRTRAHVTNTAPAPASVQSSSQRVGA